MKIFLKHESNGEIVRSRGDYTIESMHLFDATKIERICRIEVDDMKEAVKISGAYAGSIPLLRSSGSFGQKLSPKQVWVGDMAQTIVRGLLMFFEAPEATKDTNKSGIQNL